MTTSTDYTSLVARPAGEGLVAISVVDADLHRFHVIVARRETTDVRLDSIVRHALAARYAPGRPTRG